MPAPIANTARSAGRAEPAAAPPPPAPGFLDTIGLAARTSIDETTDAQQGRILQAYEGLADTLVDMGVPRDSMAATRQWYEAPALIGAQPLDYDKVWSEAARRGVKVQGANRDEFERLAITRGGQRALDQAQLAQAGGIGGAVAQFIGSTPTAMGDSDLGPLQFMVGGGGANLIQRAVGEGAVNLLTEAVQMPERVGNRNRLGETMTMGEQATDLASAFVAGAGLTVAGHLGGKAAGKAASAVAAKFHDVAMGNLERMPAPLRERYLAGRYAKAQDPGLLADVVEALMGDDGLSDAERSALVVARSEAADARSNPFAPDGAGSRLHDDMMAAAWRAAIDANPMDTSARAMATALAPPRAVGERPSSAAIPGAIDRFMGKVRVRESDGIDNARNPRSSATGRYQFTESTWLHYYKTRFGSGGLTDAAILAKRANGQLQDVLMRDLTQHNASLLRAAGIAPNEGNLYLAHFAGPEGARRLHAADPGASVESVLGEKAVAANPFLRGKTARDVIAWAHGKMGSAAEGASVRVRPDVDGGEAGPLQAELDNALNRASVLADRQREAMAAQDGPDMPDALAPIERADLPEAPAVPREPMARDPRAPRAEVLAILPQLRELADTPGRSLNRIEGIAKDLGVSAQDVRDGLTALVVEGRITMNRKSGNWMRKPAPPSGPEDVLDFVARMGGLRDDEGHALGLRGVSARERRELDANMIRNTKRQRAGRGKRDWQRMTRRNGPLLRHEGQSIDAMGELLHAHGYLNAADGSRPTTADVLDYLEKRISTGKAAYPHGEGAAPDMAAAEDRPFQLPGHDAGDIEALMPHMAEVEKALSAWGGIAPGDLHPDTLLDLASMLRGKPEGMSTDEAIFHAFHMMEARNAEDAIAESALFDYEDTHYVPSEPIIPDGADFPPAEDFFRWEPDGPDPAAGGGRGEVSDGDPRAAGEALAHLDAQARAPFLDPESQATKLQADSLEHDARASSDRVAQAQEAWAATVEKLQSGEISVAPEAIFSPELGVIDMVWGEAGDPSRAFGGGFGLAHIIAKHGREGIVEDLPTRIASMQVVEVAPRGKDRIILEGPGGRAVVATTFHDEKRHWVLTAYDPNWKEPSASATTPRAPDGGETGSTLPEGATNIGGADNSAKSPDAQADFAAPTQDQARFALERQGDGRLKGKRPQKAPGSDGGLFDSGARDVEFRFEDEGGEETLGDILDGIDADAAEIKNIRDCL